MLNEVIVFSSARGQRSGIYFYGLEILDLLQEKNIATEWMGFIPPDPGRSFVKKVHCLSGFLFFDIFRLIYNLRHRNIIFTSPSIYSVLGAIFCNSVVVYHDFLVFKTWRAPVFRRSLKKAIYRANFLLHKNIVFINDAVAAESNFHVNYYNEKKISIIPNNVSLQFIGNVAGRSSLVTRFESKSVSIAFIGAAVSFKGYPSLKSFVLDLLADGWSVSVFVTSSDVGASLHDFFSSFGTQFNVEVIWSEDLPWEVYLKTDVLLFYSFGEGWGRPIFEALRCGCIPLVLAESNIDDVWGGRLSELGVCFESNCEARAVLDSVSHITQGDVQALLDDIAKEYKIIKENLDLERLFDN